MPTDIRGMTGAGKVPDHTLTFEDRRDYRHIVDLARCLPGIVGDQHITWLESFCRICLQEMAHACRHRVNVPGSTCERLGNH